MFEENPDLFCTTCPNPLTTEIEMTNRVCLTCQYENDRENKLAHYDEMHAAALAVLTIAPLVVACLCPVHVQTWERIVERLRIAVAYGGVL